MPRFRSAALSLVLGLALCGSALADGAWVPLAPGAAPAAAAVRLETASAHQTTALISVPGMRTEQVVLGGERFARLALEGTDEAGMTGQPRVPVVRRMIAVPPGAAVSVRLELLGARDTRPLAAFGVPSRLEPVQPPAVKLPDAVPQFAFDRAYYALDTFGIEPGAQVVDRVRVRDREFVLVEIRPFAYNPARGLLTWWTEARLVVDADGGDVCGVAPRDSRGGALMTAGLALNDAVVPPAPCAATNDATAGAAGPGGAEGLLVIVHDNFAATVAPLLDWKEKTGFKVVIKKTSEIADGTPTDAEIKQVVQQAYDTWTSPRLGYLLLIGDTDFTAIHTGNGGGNSQATDNWYACTSGSDYLPDIAEARISVRTVQQAQDVVDKLMTYERATFPATTWIKKSGFIGTGDSGYISMVEGTHDWCIDSFYKPNGFLGTGWSHGYGTSDRHYNTYNADTSEISASINEGRTLVNYSGHGGNNSWVGPTGHGGYETANVQGNSNDGMYPFVISNACVTGSLFDTECFAETWQRVPHKGAIGYLGASNNSYWNEDDYFQRQLHTNLFPMDSTPPLATVNNRAKIALYNHYGNTGTMAYYFDMYNLLSDPTVLMWTRAPRALEVQYDAQVAAGSTSLAVSVRRAGGPAANELVAVRKKDEGVFSAGYTDAAGHVTLTLSPAPLLPGPMEVTVTGHDDQPFEGTTDVVPMDGPWLRLKAHAVSDAASACDADGVPDIGENATFNVTIENIGSAAAAGAWAALSSTADVAVLSSPLALGTIPAGGQAQATFTVRIGAGVGCQQNGAFTVQVGCPDCTVRQDGFTELLESDHRIETDDESMEHAGTEPTGWSHLALVGTDDWKVVTTQNQTPGGRYSYFSSDRSMQKDVVLVSDPFQPQGISTLRFWQRVELTATKSGGRIEITANGGATWTDLNDLITEHPYTHEIGLGTDKHKCWSASSGGWVRTSVDLSSYAGSTVRVRFRLGTLNGTNTGWWIDDVALTNDFVGCDVHACGIPEAIALGQMTWTGGATHITWGDDVVATHYKVWCATDCSSPANFVDVTALDDDDTDTQFSDPFGGAFACWVVQGIGPDGAGPR